MDLDDRDLIGSRVIISDHRGVYGTKMDGKQGVVQEIDHKREFPYGVQLDGLARHPLFYFYKDELVVPKPIIGRIRKTGKGAG